MPRTIDADALTSVLEKWEEQVCDGTENDGSDGTTRVLHPVPTTTREVIDLIADQPTIDPTPQWIPVMEMEPERTGWFLTFGPQRKTAVVHFDSDGVWSDEDDYNIDVTHWMPLPETPKDGGAENAPT